MTASPSLDCFASCGHLTFDAGIGLIVGGTGCGKTQLLIDLINREMLRSEGPRWAKVIFLCPTARMGAQTKYFAGFPDRDIVTEPDLFIDTIRSVMEHQGKTEHWSPVLLVFDDVVGCMRGKTDKEFGPLFDRLVTGGRHMGIFTIVLTQYLKDRIFSSTTVRGNLCFVAAAASGLSDVNRDKVVELLGEGKEKSGNIIAAAAGENYRFVVKDFSSASKRPAARISLVKVDPTKTPRLTVRYRD